MSERCETPSDERQGTSEEELKKPGYQRGEGWDEKLKQKKGRAGVFERGEEGSEGRQARAIRFFFTFFFRARSGIRCNGGADHEKGLETGDWREWEVGWDWIEMGWDDIHPSDKMGIGSNQMGSTWWLTNHRISHLEEGSYDW